MSYSFRSLVIDLLDSPDGIPANTYSKLHDFADENYPNDCDDIWDATKCGSGINGVCIFLDEDIAEELRNKS